MNVSVRRARSEDYASINELATLLVGFSSDRRGLLSAVLASQEHDLVVAETGGTVVGFAHLLVYADLSHGALAGELLALIVGEEFRKRGIGTALFHEVCRLAKERGVRELHINTEQDNATALRFYKKFGAEIVGVQLELEVQ